ncbi:MAG TPA: DUF424 family protein [Candidatus Nanoarchaeia archaeon]|nr:DUF424 family protein [Candidatus Nanoarchaeia archaeon]
MNVNIIKSYRDVIAICDSNLLGKTFEEGKLQLEVKESFYKGREISESELIEIMEEMSGEDATFNIVGKESTKAAIKAGIIEEESVKTIAGIPFALILS